MSRGLGAIERAVAEAFLAHPERVYSVADLVRVAHPTARVVTKSHRVATLRAANRVGSIMGWRKTIGGVPREARYARPRGLPSVGAVPEPSAVPAAPPGPADVLADRVAANMIAFLSGVLDPAGVATFVGELDRTTVSHLRRRL